ncbi:MAG: DUF4346 domain-containing protein [Cyanobacteria bacterium P01_F01_bin.150]
MNSTQPYSPLNSATIENITALDNKLSNRFIELDPEGYFLIYLEREEGFICAAHYRNSINTQGIAVDPETGKPIPCKGPVKRTPSKIYKGRTAKELGIKLTEEADPCQIGRLDHALYLGREFVRAEIALISGQEYIQD